VWLAPPKGHTGGLSVTAERGVPAGGQHILALSHVHMPLSMLSCGRSRGVVSITTAG
jgi:hypothetical protein